MNDTRVEPSIIVREIDAPRELVFSAWTEVRHLSNWMFPMPGCRCEYVSADIVDGGSSLHKVTMPNGYEMWLYTVYEKVAAPDELVFLQYMSNENGDILPNPRIPNWPKDMLASLSFEELAESRTRLTFLWQPRNPTADEISVFEDSREDHGKGWGAGMDQLEIYLQTIS
ncbi:MAG: SRPBCC domain-containing protein [Pseudomonadota bacterium]